MPRATEETDSDAMKSLLAKIAIRRFVGLYLGEHEVSVSEVAVTPLGPIEINSRTEPCPPNELLNVIERVLQSLHGRKQRRLQVAIGLPNSRVFFGTRPLRSAADSSPEGVMQKLLCSSNVSICASATGSPSSLRIREQSHSFSTLSVKSMPL